MENNNNMYKKILVRFGELSTKGKNKMTFVRFLAKNIKKIVGVKPEVTYDRIYLPYSEEVMEKLQYVFGIYSYSPIVEVDTNVEAIEEAISEHLPNFKGETFKIQAKRHWKQFELNSMELNQHFGGHVLRNSELKVDIKNPDIKVELEIRKGTSYLFFERTKGLGGYPTGINGKVLHLMSGGIDSPVAALELMKRGLKVDFLNFITPPHTDDLTVKKVNKIITELMKYQGKTTVFRSNYTDLLNLLGLVSKQSYKINLMRRSFYRIATTIAHQRGYLALSNGENLGQVASQTMESINTISSQSDLPIFRPLLTADKIETIEKAKRYGTYEISIEKANESCELFAPAAPVIKPKEWEAQKLEDELEDVLELEKDNLENHIHEFTINVYED